MNEIAFGRDCLGICKEALKGLEESKYREGLWIVEAYKLARKVGSPQLEDVLSWLEKREGSRFDSADRTAVITYFRYQDVDDGQDIELDLDLRQRHDPRNAMLYTASYIRQIEKMEYKLGKKW